MEWNSEVVGLALTEGPQMSPYEIVARHLNS
jgi:hypothetical protein